MSDVTNQLKATAALLMILTVERLPDCEWTVYRGLGLEGSILDPDGDPMYAVQQWAQRFGTDVRRNESTGVLYTSGTYSHVHVRVFVQGIPR